MYMNFCDGVPTDSMAYNSEESTQCSRSATLEMGKVSRVAQAALHRGKQDTWRSHGSHEYTIWLLTLVRTQWNPRCVDNDLTSCYV
jgi:hypothetical protein